MKRVFGGITKQQIGSTLLVLAVLFAGMFAGYVRGYVVGTGTYPFVSETRSVVPPDVSMAQSSEVDTFVAEDKTSLEQYDVGFNCVEFALLAARNAQWKGIAATVVRLDFSDGTGHMILGFPTEDAGWRFLQVEGGEWVYPHVGGMFGGEKIAGIYYLSDFVWEPIEEAEI